VPRLDGTASETKSQHRAHERPRRPGPVPRTTPIALTASLRCSRRPRRTSRRSAGALGPACATCAATSTRWCMIRPQARVSQNNAGDSAPVAFLRFVGGSASPRRLLITGEQKLHGDLVAALALPATTEPVARSSATSCHGGPSTVSGMAPATYKNGTKQGAPSTSEQRRMYRVLRERTERQQHQRQQKIERLVHEQRERRLRSFRRPSR
jgi:hypothetical protein